MVHGEESIKLIEQNDSKDYEQEILNDYKRCIEDVEQMADIQQSLTNILGVHEEHIQSIETNISKTETQVESGNKELKKASKIYWKIAGGMTAGIGGAAVAGPIGLYYGIKGYSLLGLATGSGLLTGIGFKKIKKY